MAPDKPSIITTYSHEHTKEQLSRFEVKLFSFEVTVFRFEVTFFRFEVTLFRFEVTPLFCKELYIKDLQRPPNSNILFIYLCIYVVRLLYTKAKGKRKGFEAFFSLLLNHTKHTAEHSGKQITPYVIMAGVLFFGRLDYIPKSSTTAFY